MPTKLSSDDLYRCCDPGTFTFQTTEDLVVSGNTIGQEKALRSIDFGLSLASKGFNLFALGEGGTGKKRTVMSLVSERAATETVPADWCYVYNFKDPDVPLAVSLPPGRAVVFKRDMEELIKVLKVEIPKAFESKEYEKQRSRIIEEFQQRQKDLFTRLE